MIDKPKTSLIEKMSQTDLESVNKLLILCGTYYDRLSNPPNSTPHRNPQELDDLKHHILSMSLKVGERLWYPRGKRKKNAK